MKQIKSFSQCPPYEILFSHKVDSYEHKSDGYYSGIYAFKTRQNAIIDLYDINLPWYDVLSSNHFKENLFLNSNIFIPTSIQDNDIISHNLLKLDHGRFSEYIKMPQHPGYKNKDRQLYLIFIKQGEVNKKTGQLKNRVLVYFAVRKELNSTNDLSWIIYNSKTKLWEPLEVKHYITFIKYVILPTETITYEMYKDAL